jgi:sugar lactone lactonase YvrE
MFTSTGGAWCRRAAVMSMAVILTSVTLPVLHASATTPSNVPAVTLTIVDDSTNGSLSGIDQQNQGSSVVTNIVSGDISTAAYDPAGDFAYVDGAADAIDIQPTGGGPAQVVEHVGNVTQALAFDGVGNLYYLQQQTGTQSASGALLYEIPAGTDSPQLVNTPTLGQLPYGLTIDGAGNFYMTFTPTAGDPLGGALLELTPGGTQLSVVDSDLEHPDGLTLDSSGNLYLADQGNGTPDGGSIYEYANDPSHARTQIASGLDLPLSVAIDPSGDLYASELPSGASGSTSVVIELAADSSGDIPPNTTPVVVSSGYADATQVLVPPVPSAPIIGTAKPGNGQVTLAFGPPSRAGGSPITQYTVTANDLSNPANSSQTVTGTAGSLAVTGLTNLDSYAFTVTATNSFGTGPASFPSTTVVPSDSIGALFINDTNNTRVVTVDAAGHQNTVASGIPDNFGIAVDADSNAFVTDFYEGKVDEIAPSGAERTIPTQGIRQPFGIAVDRADDVFVSDLITNAVYEITAAGVESTVPTTGLDGPHGVAVDSAGDVFVADTDNDRIVEVTPAGVQTTVPTQGLDEPIGLAVDHVGNIYITDANHNRVVEVTPAGVQTTIARNFADPLGVAVDASGDVFIADALNNRVVEVAPSGAEGTVPTTGLTTPYSVGISPTQVQTFPVSAVVPDAPTIGAVIAGNAQAQVNFVPPGRDGGSTISGYTVTAFDTTNSSNGGQTASGASGPLTVTGLTNGDSYTFSVTATNSIGTSLPSDLSNAVIPFTPTTRPTVTGVSPNSGPATGGTVVTVTGTGFTGATSVAFGLVTGTNLTVLNDSTLTVTSPNNFVGAHDLVVTTPNGSNARTTAGAFTGLPTPTVTGVSPSSGPATGGTVVTVTGTGFTGATSVTFGGVPGANVTVLYDTTLTVSSPANFPGIHYIQVSTPGGTNPRVTAGGFTYL